jgi:aminoglycoside phosphotransferase (APT) family kinase protein
VNPSRFKLDEIGSAIERRFPDADPVRPLRMIGSGFRSVALETPAGVVFLVGSSPDAAGDYAKEWRVGAFLAEQLGALVPMPRWYATPCDEFPHGVLGYRKLPGATPAWGVDAGEPFARDLGAFMARLHRIATGEALEAGVPWVDAFQRVLGARDVVLPVLRTRLESEDYRRIESWWTLFAQDGRMRCGSAAVCHHDLWHDNLLRSESGRLTGVLDLAHVEISDPAHDFAAPSCFGERFVAQLVDAYRAGGGRFDVDVEYRAARFYEAREFGGLAWAIEHDDELEIEAAVEKIRCGPVLAAS